MKCEGCGAIDASDGYVHIHLLNGGLCLCRPCLAEFNGKNPETKRLREGFKKLLGAVAVPLEALHAVYGRTNTFNPVMKQSIANAVEECRAACGLLLKGESS